MIKSELLLVWDQIATEQKDKEFGRSEEDYLIRGEHKNQGVRWGLTLAIAIAYVVRIFYFDRVYFLFTFLLGHIYLCYLHKYVFTNEVSVLEASDGMRVSESDPTVFPTRPLISVCFRHKMSPAEFNSLVLRILEFKFWYGTTKSVLLALLLSRYSLFRFPNVGPALLLLLIFFHGYEFRSVIISRRSTDITFVNTYVLE